MAKIKRGNGCGSVYKLSGNRRNPWVARITNGFNDNGHPIYIFLEDDSGRKYFPDDKIPNLLLAKYNLEKGNIDILKSHYTFEQVFEEYKLKYFPTKKEILQEKTEHKKAKGKLGVSTMNNLNSAYKKCSSLYKKKYKTLKKEDFEAIISKTTGCGTVINSLANLFRKLDNYALSQDIIVKGYADLIKINEDMFLPTQNEGMPYTYEEIETLWQNNNSIETAIVLATIYTGCRIEELLFAKIKDIFLEDGYFIAGLKTTAGKRRIIPIHSEIKPIFEKYYDCNNEFLFTINNQKIDYNKHFLKLYRNLMKQLNMEYHKTHDGRKTLHSELDRLGANEVCMNKIFGHKGKNIGDDAYTKKSIEELKSTIELVDFRNQKDKKITYLNISNLT